MNNSVDERRKTILDLLKNSEFIQNMEMEFVELNEESAIAKIPFKSKFLNAYGSMHGGFLYALGDTVAGSLASMCGDFCTTVDGSMNYFEPAIDTDYIYCHAKRIRAGRSLVNIKIEIRDDNNKLLDDGSFNYYRLKNR